MGVIKLNKAGQANKIEQVGEKIENTKEKIVLSTENAEDIVQDALAMDNPLWDDPAILREDESRITENSRHYVLNNGTTKSIYTASPVNFYDEDEKKWKKIDNSFEECEDCYEARLGKFKAQVTKAEHKKAVKISGHGISVSWEYLGKKQKDTARLANVTNKNTEKPVVLAIKKNLKSINCISRDGEAVYENIEDNTNLQYILQGNNVKENIIVKERAEEYKYLFSLNTEGLTMRLSEDNKSIELCSEAVYADGVKENKVEFTIPSPYMYDAEGNHSEDVYYEIEEESDGKYIFAVVADSAWINEFNRAFPITIDPQIVTDSTAYIKSFVKFRNVSTFSVGNWQSENSEYLKVSRTASLEYKTTIKIEKFKMNLPESKINRVKLILKPYQINTRGNCYIGNSSVYVGDSNVVVADITNSFRNNEQNFDVNIDISCSDYVNVVFYPYPVLEIEFLTNEHSRPVVQTFNLAGEMTGNYNVTTGDMTVAFRDMPDSDSIIGFGIAHIFKRSGIDFHCGKNFRLNLNESLVKGEDFTTLDADYIYTDAYGDKHGFKDTYYYYDSKGIKQSISDKKDIEIELDGELSYKPDKDKSNYKVYKEQRTATGLTAITKLEGYKYYKYVEQRTDEYKELECQKQSYLNTLNSIVIINLKDGKVHGKLKDNLSKEQYTTFISNARNVDYLLCTESEAINYRSLLAQQKSMVYQFESLGLQVESMDNQKDYNTGLSSEENIAEYAKTYYTDTNNNLEKQIDNIESQKTLLGLSDNSIGSQRDIVFEQIHLIRRNKNQYVQQIEDYYKEYLNIEYKLSQMDNQLPVNYLSDGKIIKGFNKAGNLVAIFDQYENSMTVEYDDKGKIIKVYDGTNKQIVFDYWHQGLLKSITDTRGKINTYENTNDRLTKITSANGKTVEISYDDKDNSIITITSSDKIQSSLTYSNYGLNKVVTKSDVANISNGKPSITLNSIPMSEITFAYSPFLTTIEELNGNKKYYKIDETGNVSEYYEENNGIVIKAEKYEYVPYSKDNITSARRETLFKKGYDSFSYYDFYFGDYVNIDLDEFNNAVVKYTNAMQLSDGTRQQTSVYYKYDDNHRCIKQTTQVTVDKGSSTLKTVKQITACYYNAQGSVVRKESYVEGEELTSGIKIEETEFDAKGRPGKSFTYNSLDSSSKFYTESEYSENGKTLAELDETGEYKTALEYVGDTDLVRTQKLPNGSKFSYGYDIDDNVTSITQSTEEGEENSTHTRYTCGEVTELVSGNNKVQYDYDNKRRLSKVNLNGIIDYVTYTYGDKISATINGTDKTVNKVTATYVTRKAGLASDVFETLTDMNGNILQTVYNGTDHENKNYTEKAEWVYRADNKLTAFYDINNNRTVNNEYDGLDRLTTYIENSGGTELIKETYDYDDYGSVLSKTVTGQATHTYNYVYKQDASHTLESITCGALKVMPKTDVNGRNIGKELYISNAKKAEERITYRKVGDHATKMPSAVWYGNTVNGNYVIHDNVKYVYDEMGNIVKIYSNGEMSVRYAYDKLSRLVREDNKALDKTWLYAYDNNGNIISKREFNYTLRATELMEELESTDRIYSYFGDRLMGYGNEIFEYDNIGNPLKYRGKTASWSKARQLQSLGGTTFTYDAQGRRISKGNITYTYDSEGRIIKQSNGLEYIYDNTGVAGVLYNGAIYIYRKDVQGNIVALLDSNGLVVVRYNYDAWGNHGVEVLNSACATLAELNPFRYRGYYYDVETELYYLQTRYYDPETGRFITIDGIEYIDPETINGLNLYAYCGNNPVMNVDPTGHAWWEWVLGIVIIIAAVALSVVTAGLATPIAAALGGGMLGAIVGGAVAGAVGGAIASFGISVATQGISNGFNNIDWGQVGWATLGGAVTGAVLGGISGGLSYLRSTTALYRAVDINEYNSIKATGKFSLKDGAFEGKQFGLKLKEVRNYAKLDFNKGVYYKIVKTRVSNSVFSQFSNSSIDAFVFKSGVVTVSGSQMNLLNNTIRFLKFFKI